MADDGDELDIARVLDHAGEPAAAWDTVSIKNADLLAEALLSVALNRAGTVPAAAQVKAIALVWAYTDGAPHRGPVAHDASCPRE